jgi:hypothetical protein
MSHRALNELKKRVHTLPQPRPGARLMRAAGSTVRLGSLSAAADPATHSAPTRATVPGMLLARAAGTVPPPAPTLEKAAESRPQNWNWHAQNTDIVQGDFGFPAKYSGPASLNRGGEVQETVSLDVFSGVRLWHGAEAHVDALMWQGFGLTQTHGIEAFPNGDAYKAGLRVPQYQFVANPAFNSARGPVSIFGARLHGEF